METVLHITHWKAGSTWLRRVLRQLAAERFVRQPPGWDPFPEPVAEGSVYSAYATRQQVEAAGMSAHRRFVVVRDLRDTLVSAYFSFRDTHASNAMIDELREPLLERDFEEGMIFLMEGFLPRCAAIQASWRDEPVIHYEDLLSDDAAILHRTLVEGCGFEISDARFEEIVANSRFRRLTGRKRGEEAAEHLRKGIAGDWRNHFTDRIAAEFDARFEPGEPSGQLRAPRSSRC